MERPPDDTLTSWEQPPEHTHTQGKRLELKITTRTAQHGWHNKIAVSRKGGLGLFMWKPSGGWNQ